MSVMLATCSHPYDPTKVVTYLEACFSNWANKVDKPVYRVYQVRSTNFNSMAKKFFDILLRPVEENGLGLGEFFEPEHVEIAKKSGRLISINRPYTQLLAMFSPFRLVEEASYVARYVVKLVEQDKRNAVASFFIAHMGHTGHAPFSNEHSIIFHPKINKSTKYYLDRIREADSERKAQQLWCGQQQMSIPNHRTLLGEDDMFTYLKLKGDM